MPYVETLKHRLPTVARSLEPLFKRAEMEMEIAQVTRKMDLLVRKCLKIWNAWTMYLA